MDSELKVSTKKITGRRPDLSKEPSVFPVLTEEPSEAVKMQSAAARGSAKWVRVVAWIGTVLVWLPLLLSIVYYVYIAIKQTQYALFYAFLVFTMLRLPILIGGACLFVAAAASKRYPKWIGFTALGVLLLPFIAMFTASGANLTNFASNASTATATPVGIALYLLMYICILALHVLSILLLVKLNPKRKSVTEKTPVNAQ
ncbi:hypothetical protein SDC9_135355 [bioreactor metagenome]|uniref:Uncharacterized protein n=1 Tax=bioreactor metagenome TaxID=1076179 RepID=A0A645DFL9_9ZZZZ